jgi:hypothetical protein
MTTSTVVFDVNLSLDGFVAAGGGLPRSGTGGPHPPTPVFVITHAPPAQTPCGQDVEGRE